MAPADELIDVLFDAQHVGHCLVDPLGSVQRVNEAWLEATGQAADRVLGSALAEVIPGCASLFPVRLTLPLQLAPVGTDASADTFLHTVRPVVRGDQRWLLSTLRRRCADGRHGDGDVRTGHQPPMYERWRLALAAARMGWWHYDPRTGVSTFDERYGEILGVGGSADDTLRLLELLVPEDRQRVWTAVAAALDPSIRAPYHIQYHVRRPDGTERWVESYGRVTFASTAPHQPTSFIGTVMDVTEQKRAELELRLLATAVEQTPASVVITDGGGVIEYVNPAFERLSSRLRGEMVGTGKHVLDADLADPAQRDALLRGLESSRPWAGRVPRRTADGRTVIEDVVIAPVLEHGVVRHHVLVGRDVTEELALQAHLAQSQRMESVGRLAGGVAHDFNNLLTVILGSTGALRGALEARGDPIPDELADVELAARRAAELTRKLLAFARNQPSVPRPLHLGTLVTGMEPLLQRMLRQDIELVVTGEANLWPVLGDATQVEQVLMNLVINARDAMPSGGRLVISTRNLPAAGPEGDGVALVVQDSGVGIAPEVLAHIFEPFFTTKPAGQGTGLGLATVYGIVHQAGGHVAVESEPGRGARFTVRLPRLA